MTHDSPYADDYEALRAARATIAKLRENANRGGVRRYTAQLDALDRFLPIVARATGESAAVREAKRRLREAERAFQEACNAQVAAAREVMP